jgi:hypothetical protein
MTVIGGNEGGLMTFVVIAIICTIVFGMKPGMSIKSIHVDRMPPYVKARLVGRTTDTQVESALGTSKRIRRVHIIAFAAREAASGLFVPAAAPASLMGRHDQRMDVSRISQSTRKPGHARL